MGSIDGIAGAVARATTSAVRAAAPHAPAPAVDLRRPLHGDAAAVIALLGSAPLQPTGAVADALAAGRLLRTGTAASLDAREAILRTGRIDDSSRTPVGQGINGLLHKVRIADPDRPDAAATWAVEKSASQQAAQEEFGWRLARELGIDHLFPAVARRSDGVARIELRAGRAASLAGIHDAARLEEALAKHYLDDAALGLSAVEAAQAARIDRQLLQVFDYLLANNDRSSANTLWDAARGVSYIDAGHAGRGALAANGGTQLEPALQLFQAGRTGGRVQLDDVVVDYVARRLDAERIRAIHAAVFDAPGVAGPIPHTLGEKFLGHVAARGFPDGISARLKHLVANRGYAHRPYAGDNAGELPPLEDHHQALHGARGFTGVRAALHGGLF